MRVFSVAQCRGAVADFQVFSGRDARAPRRGGDAGTAPRSFRSGQASTGHATNLNTKARPHQRTAQMLVLDFVQNLQKLPLFRARFDPLLGHRAPGA